MASFALDLDQRGAVPWREIRADWKSGANGSCTLPLRWLRATGWMVLLFIIFAIVYAGAQAVGNPLFSKGGAWLEVLEVATICAAGLGLCAGIVRLAEGRWPEELSPRLAPADLVIGLLVGAAMLSTVVGGLYALGVYQISGPRPASACGHDRHGGRVRGDGKELWMRAIVLRLLMRAFGIWPALVLQAALFGALHLGELANASPRRRRRGNSRHRGRGRLGCVRGLQSAARPAACGCRSACTRPGTLTQGWADRLGFGDPGSPRCWPVSSR
ncbi:hypothetical protein ACRAWD_21635 [Caulobacter segnis]